MTNDEILNDIRRRYENTFVFVKEPKSDDQSLFFVDRIEAGDTRFGVMHLSSLEVGRIKLNIGSAHEIKFVPAPVGVFQHNESAFICRRKPVKQYRRGVCCENTSIFPVQALIEPTPEQMTMERVQAAFDRVVYSFKDALNMLAKGKYRSVALRNDFSITLPFNRNGKNYVLFHWDIPVAKITPEGEIAQIIEAVFEKHIHNMVKA